MEIKKLQFIWHDCFVFTDEDIILVFDYWKDPLCARGDLPGFIKNADKDKHLYVFVSHHHKDHYSTRIYEWEKYFANVTFIISDDVRKYSKHIFSSTSTYNRYKPNPGNMMVMSAGEVFSDENIKVSAFGSTDIGNSYAIKVGNVSLFHAGDLNAWLWKDESTEDEIAKSRRDYLNVLKEIGNFYENFDIVMFPVDSRIGSGYYEGAAIFLKKFDVKRFFPMHFNLGETEAEIQKYIRDARDIEKYANPERGEYICLTSPYDLFAFSKFR